MVFRSLFLVDPGPERELISASDRLYVQDKYSVQTLRSGPHMAHLFRKMVPQRCPGSVFPGKNQASLLIQRYDTYIAKCNLNLALVISATVPNRFSFSP